MATLSNPRFEVDILTGMPNDYRVISTVNIDFTPFEAFLVNAGLPLQLQSHIWAYDQGLADSTDDLLFSFPTQSITAPGTYTFTATVPRSLLNEDNTFYDKSDELYSKFSLVSGSNFFPLNIATDSPQVRGLF